MRRLFGWWLGLLSAVLYVFHRARVNDARIANATAYVRSQQDATWEQWMMDRWSDEMDRLDAARAIDEAAE